MPVSLAETEDSKRNDVRYKCQHHTAATPKQIGDCATGDFHEVDYKLPEADEKAYPGKGKPLLKKEQYDKRFKVALVLEESV